jgi:NAD(P)-dependent dehydrogenase (short-subunit alcohol dehydrogenase family)
MGREFDDMAINQLERFGADEWVWVSGASSGIGRAIARQLAREGVGVVLSARREEVLTELADEITGAGGRALAMPCDVSDGAALKDAVGIITQRIGRIDGVVPCAGIELLAPFKLMKPEKWSAMLNLHVIGAFEMARASLTLLKASGKRENEQGRVVFVASTAALRGWPSQSVYASCKAAVLGGMRSLAVELAPHSIRVNAVSPGLVKTDMQARMFNRIPEEQQGKLEAAHPLGLGAPEDVANAVTFLLSRESRWITGQGMVVDGGLSIA